MTVPSSQKNGAEAWSRTWADQGRVEVLLTFDVASCRNVRRVAVFTHAAALLSHTPMLQKRAHHGRYGDADEASQKGLVCLNDQRACHPPGCPIELFALVDPLQNLRIKVGYICNQ